MRYEFYEDMPTAIAREKQLKRYRRDWKRNLIEAENPRWEDLGPGLGLPPSADGSRPMDPGTGAGVTKKGRVR